MNSLADRPGLVRVALLGLLALVVLGADLPEIHDHAAGAPGLYNEDCPLVRLALPTWGLPALAEPTLPRPDPLPDTGPPPALAWPSATVRWAYAPRAPPTNA